MVFCQYIPSADTPAMFRAGISGFSIRSFLPSFFESLITLLNNNISIMAHYHSVYNLYCSMEVNYILTNYIEYWYCNCDVSVK